jgi:hypothetical protein
MRALPRLIITLAVFVTALHPAAAPTAAAQERSPFAGDTRLDREVSVAWKKATLHEALDTLSTQTGVRLTPDRGIVDEPVMVSATDISARALLEEVATLLGFTWRRSGGTAEEPTYLLFQSRAAREAEEEEILGSRRRVLEAIQRELERHRAISRLPPAELEAETRRVEQSLEDVFSGGFAGLASDPDLGRRMQEGMATFSVASPVGRTLLDLVDRLSPGQWEMLMNDQALVYGTAAGGGEMPLPGDLADRLRSAQPGLPLPRSALRSLGPQVDGALDQVEQLMQQQWQGSSGLRVSIRMSLSLGSQPMGMLQVTPEPMGEGVLGMLFAASGLNIMGAPGAFEEPEEDPAARAARLAEDPVLGRQAPLVLPEVPPRAGFFGMLGTSHRVADVLQAVEDAFGVPLLADAYNRQAIAVIPTMQGDVPAEPDLGTRPSFRDSDAVYAALAGSAGARRRLQSRPRGGDRVAAA